eukprot:scaffold52525_cov75-Phaeocystis_antarctica.AAC.10
MRGRALALALAAQDRRANVCVRAEIGHRERGDRCGAHVEANAVTSRPAHPARLRSPRREGGVAKLVCEEAAPPLEGELRVNRRQLVGRQVERRRHAGQCRDARRRARGRGRPGGARCCDRVKRVVDVLHEYGPAGARRERGSAVCTCALHPSSRGVASPHEGVARGGGVPSVDEDIVLLARAAAAARVAAAHHLEERGVEAEGGQRVVPREAVEPGLARLRRVVEGTLGGRCLTWPGATAAEGALEPVEHQ